MDVESTYHDAFAHWVFESLLLLTTTDRSSRIIIRAGRDYKRKMLKHLGWSDDNIITVCSDQPITTGNQLSLIQLPISEDRFRGMFQHLFSLLREPTCPDFQTPLLYLPRSKVQNYTSNDRIIVSEPDIRQWVVRRGGRAIDVLDLPDWTTQARWVGNTQCLLVDYGSALWVNALVAQQGTVIIVLGYMDQHIQYPAMACIWQEIRTRAKAIHFVYPNSQSTNQRLYFDVSDLDKIKFPV